MKQQEANPAGDTMLKKESPSFVSRGVFLFSTGVFFFVICCIIGIAAASGALTSFFYPIQISFGEEHYWWKPEWADALLAGCIVLVAVIGLFAPLRIKVQRLIASYPDYFLPIPSFLALLYIFIFSRYPLDFSLFITGCAGLIIYLVAKKAPTKGGLAEKSLPTALVVFTTLILVVLSFVIYQHLPYVVDSVTQWNHARLLLDGKFAAPLPAISEFFQTENMVFTEKGWVSQYLPGHILLVALMETVRAGWLLNPIGRVISVWFTYRIGAHLYGKRTGIVAAVFLTISPYFLIMQSGWMNHGTAMPLLIICTWLTISFEESPCPLRRALAIGFCAGLAFISRPLTVAGLLLPLFVFSLIRIWP